MDSLLGREGLGIGLGVWEGSRIAFKISAMQRCYFVNGPSDLTGALSVSGHFWFTCYLSEIEKHTGLWSPG